VLLRRRIGGIYGLNFGLKMKAIAEGVETPGQLAYLRHHGCDEMQGYYFSHPLCLTEIEKLLTNERHVPELGRETLPAS
jgi:EAL domain-containing protein (putative c-di-GMP-specific phosphodiesterase class I)